MEGRDVATYLALCYNGRTLMKTCIFLGAGASKADGAPTQNDLFRDYFSFIKTSRSRPWGDYNQDMERELRTFFSLMFDIDVDQENLGQVNFPTFEEALGILDLAERRGESFKEYGLGTLANNS